MTLFTRMMIVPALAAAFVFAGDTSEAQAQGFGLSIGGGRGLSINSFGGYGNRGVSPYYGSAYRGSGISRGYGYSSRRPSYGYGTYRPSYSGYRSYRAPVVVPSYGGGRSCY